MIVCHCNVLTAEDIISVFEKDHILTPRSPAQVQRCLGCAPQCGCCAKAVRELMAEKGLGACSGSCPTCPGNEHPTEIANDVEFTPIALEAAE